MNAAASSTMADLRARLLGFVRAHRLMRPGDRVLVAVSGGVDSVVLLHLMRACAERLGIDVLAAHFDHAMREESMTDAEWVCGLCRAWDVPLVHERASRPLYGEADARSERYRFLHDSMRACNAATIATAHHADDQVETVLFRMLRGTGLRGLAGIPVKRGRVIRPLLRFSKAELSAYAESHGIRHRIDPTNAELNYARNRIRNQIIPALETVRPDARDAIAALARYAARTNAAIDCALVRLERELIVSATDDVIELARPILLEYHPELRALALRRALRAFGVVPTRAQTRTLVELCERAASGAVMRAGTNVRIERAFDRIRVSRVEPPADTAILVISDQTGTAHLDLGGRHYDVAWTIADTRTPETASFDPAIATRGLELRAWRPGDRLRLGYGSKKLKKLFAERRIPVSERTRVPILADSSGRVYWVVGVARSVEAPAAATGPALNITVTDAELG